MRTSKDVKSDNNYLQVVKNPKEHPTFRSVANAIRTGIFIEKIYRRMSTSQLMSIPQNLNKFLEVSVKKERCNVKYLKWT